MAKELILIRDRRAIVDHEVNFFPKILSIFSKKLISISQLSIIIHKKYNFNLKSKIGKYILSYINIHEWKYKEMLFNSELTFYENSTFSIYDKLIQQRYWIWSKLWWILHFVFFISSRCSSSKDFTAICGLHFILFCKKINKD